VNKLKTIKNKWTILAMVFASWAIVASFLAAYYWFQYAEFTNRIGGVPVFINIGIDYGTTFPVVRMWSNNTKVLTGMTLFKATKAIANVTYDTFAGFGVYVKSINNIATNATHGWVWWKWDTNLSNWTRIDISPDAYAVADGETFLWYYESGWPPPPPP